MGVGFWEAKIRGKTSFPFLSLLSSCLLSPCLLSIFPSFSPLSPLHFKPYKDVVIPSFLTSMVSINKSAATTVGGLEIMHPFTCCFSDVPSITNFEQFHYATSLGFLHVSCAWSCCSHWVYKFITPFKYGRFWIIQYLSFTASFSPSGTPAACVFGYTAPCPQHQSCFPAYSHTVWLLLTPYIANLMLMDAGYFL